MTIEADDVVIAVRSRLASFSHCCRLSLGRVRPSARRIARWEGQICTVARLGGEEFGLLAIGMEGIALDRFAESVRRENAACDHGETLGNRSVTASIGVAEVQPACDFQRLYCIADDALYEAKHAGRNQLVLQRHVGEAGPAPDVPVRRSGWPRHHLPVD